MSNKLFFRLAAGNIRKNAKSYVPFIITSVITSAMFFMINSLANNDDLANVKGSTSVVEAMGLGTYVTAIFAAIFLFYTNSFLMKRRKKEIGLWNILGMEKKHIAKVIFLENLYIYALTIAGGLLFGLLFNKFLFLLVTKMVGVTGVPKFHFQLNAVVNTLLLFGAIFLFIFLESLRQVTFSKPIELLKGGSVGEKEPKAKWVLAVLGACCLCTGYYMAVTIKNPVKALTLFFVAVILVIVGTYLIFTAGSIALLKLLKKNKRYYYKTKHFISVSGMMYRMKQNAVGLGNICILSTMVLVMISSTSSLVIGVDDIVQKRSPYDVQAYVYGSKAESMSEFDGVTDEIMNCIKENDPTASEIDTYSFLTDAALKKADGVFSFGYEDLSVSTADIWQLYFMTLDDYNKLNHTDLTLDKGQVYINSKTDNFKNIDINGTKFSVKGEIEDVSKLMLGDDDGTDKLYVILPDADAFDGIYENQKEAYSDAYSLIHRFVGFDTKLSDDKQQVVEKKLSDIIASDDIFSGYVQSRASMDDELSSDFDGLFFIGIFLGMLFTMAAILIIYYKQISEGYDDKQRFDIMQKVGMTHSEVKSTIHFQILAVFFLPLITAGLHVAFAQPMITNILKLMGLMNEKLYLKCTLVSFGAFAVVYAIVYGLTAKVYYRIVKR